MVEQTVPADKAHLRSLLDAVDRFCLSAGLDRSAQSDFMLAVEEALINVVNHGYKGLPTGDLRLALSWGSWEGVAAIRADIQDHGHRFDPLSAPMPDLTQEVEARPVGGLGVMLMRNLSDVQTYRYDEVQGNHLTLIKFLPTLAPA